MLFEEIQALQTSFLFQTIQQLTEGANGVSGTTCQRHSDTGYDVCRDKFRLTRVSCSLTGRTYVGWNWKAGGAGVSNIQMAQSTSTVSADTTAGFSIVTYTAEWQWLRQRLGTGTLGHGLQYNTSTDYYLKMVDSGGSTSHAAVGHSSVGLDAGKFNNMVSLNSLGAATNFRLLEQPQHRQPLCFRAVQSGNYVPTNIWLDNGRLLFRRSRRVQ